MPPNIVNVLTHMVHAPMDHYDPAPLCGVVVPQGYGGTDKPVTCKRCLVKLALQERETWARSQ